MRNIVTLLENLLEIYVHNILLYYECRNITI